MSSSCIPCLASTLLLLLLLIPSLKLLINGLNSLPTLVFCLFFKAPPCVLVSLLNALRPPAEASLGALQSLADALKWVFVSSVEMGLGIIGSFLMAVLGALKNVVFGSFGELGSVFGGLLDKPQASGEGSLLELVREIIGFVSSKILDRVLETATSSAGGVFGFAMTSISALLNDPGSAMGKLVGMLKGLLEGTGSSMGGVRGIVESLVEKVAELGLGVASSSASGWFEAVKKAMDLVIESGFTVGGLVEKTKAALEVLHMEDLRSLIQSLARLGVNMTISYFLG
ncbi:uncharacterized protein LOC111456411 [Cucurbita moschata]|uniref:Uncharacterized protein LOC111456411 n=1 Tax=Cucurbita moschata TaxID=3662 RepID=A0A6J1GPW1_CUCMO|nr:uncharacterized protein LOC111456411 [Cucurbita moschata]